MVVVSSSMSFAVLFGVFDMDGCESRSIDDETVNRREMLCAVVVKLSLCVRESCVCLCVKEDIDVHVARDYDRRNCVPLKFRGNDSSML